MKLKLPFDLPRFLTRKADKPLPVKHPSSQEVREVTYNRLYEGENPREPLSWTRHLEL